MAKIVGMRRYIPLILDALLAAVCVFLLFFTLVRYYFSAGAGIAAGVVAGLAAGAGAFCYIRARQNKSVSLSACKAEAEKLAVHLAVLGNDGARALLAGCIKDAAISGEFIESPTCAYYADFKLEAATADELLPLLQLETNKKKCLACPSATPKCAEFAAAAGIELLCADGIYAVIKGAGKLPEKYLWEGKKRAKFLALVRSRFTRKLCLPAFWSGTALLFFSYFTYYPVYYIVSGSLLLLLCGAAAIFGKRKPA